MRTLIITLAAITILTSCSEKKTIVYENDTEPHEWIGQITVKDRPNAHSGKSVSVIDSLNPYSLGFRKNIKDISTEKIKKITYSYWILTKSNNIKVASVLSIDSEGKNINWQGHPQEGNLKEPNKWVKVSDTFEIPANAEGKDVLSLFVWNTSKEEILVDDFEVKVE